MTALTHAQAANLERLALAIEANVAAWYADEKTHAQFSSDNGDLHREIDTAGLSDEWCQRWREQHSAAA